MPKSSPVDELPPSWLLVATTRDGTPVYEAGWRHRDNDGSLRTMKRRLGPAWVERAADGSFVRRRGRPRPGFLYEHAAIVAKDRVVRDVERELAERADAAARAANAPPTFRRIAHAYLDWLKHVRDGKPATLREHRYLVAEPGTPYRRGGGTHRGLIIESLGDRPAAEVTTRDINTMLATLSATGVSARTVNKSRQLICAIYNYACREATFGLAHNPASAADRRPEPERARLDFYSPEQVEALARAIAAGLHRDRHAPEVRADEANARAAEDRQDAEIVRVAAYTGLRPLRFHDLRHTYGSLLVAGGVDLASVKAAMGHSRITTTERYLHARSASELADRFTQALAGADPAAPPREVLAPVETAAAGKLEA